MKKTFIIKTLGCKVNQYDSSKLVGLLESLGLEKGEKKIDLALVNSCAVTQSAITKSRRVLNQIKREYPDAKIILMGCWPQTHKLEEDMADVVWGVGNLEDLAVTIKKIFNLKTKKVNLGPLVVTDRRRYFLKIQDGCNQFCSYCIIPHSRGRLNSRPFREVTEEAKQAVRRGYKEIILTGIHLGLYGQEKKGSKMNLAKLLKQLVKIEGLERIRLSSIEVNEVTGDIIKLIKEHEKICPHLHISLQSGSDKILKLMNRPYKVKDFQNTVSKLRKAIPNIAISTDIIVGFPSENNKDFLETYNFAKKMKFSKIHVFSFSAHKKTPAYNMPNHNSKLIIQKRSIRLRALSNRLSREYKKSFKNKKVEVLVERLDKGYAFGSSEYYFDVKTKNTTAKIGQIITVKI